MYIYRSSLSRSIQGGCSAEVGAVGTSGESNKDSSRHKRGSSLVMQQPILEFFVPFKYRQIKEK